MQNKIRTLSSWIDQHFGWFFKNGNKVHCDVNDPW